jgi:hypothetical protein
MAADPPRGLTRTTQRDPPLPGTRPLSRRAAATCLLAALAVLNLLDLTTSLRPSFADALWPVPPKAAWLWGAQGAVAVVSLAYAVRRWGKAAVAQWRGLPISLGLRWFLSLWLLAHLSQVALRDEHFPFSSVAMFSSGVSEELATRTVVPTRLVLLRKADGGAEVVDLLAEGMPLAAPHDLGWDYRVGWAMRMYAPGHSRAMRILAQALVGAGHTPPLLVDGAYGLDGQPVRRGPTGAP